MKVKEAMKTKVAAFALAVPLALLSGVLNIQKAAAFNPAGYEGTSVLSPQEAQTLYLSYFREAHLLGEPRRSQSADQTYAVPTDTEVSEAEGSLAAYTQISHEAFSSLSATLQYQPQEIALTHNLRQYAVVVRGDQRLVLINGCTRSGIPVFATAIGKPAINSDWPNLLGRFSDGGSAFRAAYDPAARRIVYFVYDTLVEPQQTQPSYSDFAESFG